MIRLTSTEVMTFINGTGETLIEDGFEYKNNRSKIKIKCKKCSNIYTTTFGSFKNKRRCPPCNGNIKHTQEFVDNEFKKAGWINKSIYKNNHTKLDLRCDRKHKILMPFAHFLRGNRCIVCAGKQAHTISHVKKKAKERGYRCTSKSYKNGKEKLDFECNVKHKFKMNWNNFQQGQDCPVCKYIKLSESRFGPNNPNWNEHREYMDLALKLRMKRTKNWIIKNMSHDPNYNDFLSNPTHYAIDHIFPIIAFSKYMIENNIEDELLMRDIANSMDNIQLLSRKANGQKYSKHDDEKFKSYINEKIKACV